MKEVKLIAQHVGIKNLEHYENEVLESANLIADDGKTSMYQDILAKRKTEVDIFSGEIIKLANKFGTPLYLYDQNAMENKIKAYLDNFKSDLFETGVLYASKAFSCKGMIQLVKDMGMCLDVVSGGELYVAQQVGFDMNKVYFHGNNKSASELEFALSLDIGTIVVDNYQELGLNSETAVAFNITSKEQVILNTWYGGEMKKGLFSMMNYFLPLQGIASMHCSANTDMNGENTALFFGLSGTGKTTLSTDPKRLLIGDDEHGWDDEGVFNLEGGCYAKVINLDKESEPDIYNAIRRDALLENVTVAEDGTIDFADKSVTENTRVSYPIYHINKIVRPLSEGPAAKQVIFLSADAFGVLPPVSILTPEQTKYYFLSGFTAKLAGTERGITEPTPTFSACFGQAFLELHPTKYAEELVKKMEQSGAKAYLVNTGWNGTGKRISIRDTRGIIDAILNGSIDKAPTKQIPYFDFEVPTVLEGVDTGILDPRDTYKCACEWEEKAKDLAGRFIKNFKKYEGNEAGKALVEAGPKL